MGSTTEHLRCLVVNLRQPDMPWREWLGKVLRNRSQALAHGGCCGHPGEPGC